MRSAGIRATILVLAGTLVGAACGSDSALAPQFQPEVVNTANANFSFQATGLRNISDTLTYTWSVSSGRIKINPSTSTTSGTIVLNIRDAAGTVVYDGTVSASGEITPPAGTGGNWQITLMLRSYSGTINFRLQMQ
jgi:hypothetical protein